MTCERRLCVAILARISDTCQESVPLFRGEGADFVFSYHFSTMTSIVYLKLHSLSHQLFEVGAHGQIFLTIEATIAEIIV